MTKLQKLRKDNGISLSLLAEWVGISKVTLHRYEHGDCLPDIYVAMKIAEIFRVSVYDIWNVAESKLPTQKKNPVPKVRQPAQDSTSDSRSIRSPSVI